VSTLLHALVVIGAVGVGLGAVAYVAVLLGSDLAWTTPVAGWLTGQIRVLLLVMLMITGSSGTGSGSRCSSRTGGSAAGDGRAIGPPGFAGSTSGSGGTPRSSGSVAAARSGSPSTQLPGRASNLALTAFWVVFHATVLLLASMWLKLCDDTRLDWPSDPAP